MLEIACRKVVIKIYVKVIDGKTEFATHFFAMKTYKSLIDKLIPIQVEPDGIVCYSQEEADRAVKILDGLKAEYAIEEIKHDIDHIKKSNGIKYASRSEAIKHLAEDVEPESQIIPNLRKKLAQKDEEIKSLQKDLSSINILANNEKAGKVL